MTLTSAESFLLALPWLGLGLWLFWKLRDGTTRDRHAISAARLKDLLEDECKR